MKWAACDPTRRRATSFNSVPTQPVWRMSTEHQERSHISIILFAAGLYDAVLGVAAGDAVLCNRLCVVVVLRRVTCAIAMAMQVPLRRCHNSISTVTGFALATITVSPIQSSERP